MPRHYNPQIQTKVHPERLQVSLDRKRDVTGFSYVVFQKKKKKKKGECRPQCVAPGKAGPSVDSHAMALRELTRIP